MVKLFDARRWSLTSRLGVFFGVAITVIVVGVSLMMYAELMHQLHEKEEAELKSAMTIQLEVLESLAKRIPSTQWQHEWDEQQEHSRLFTWQLLAADGTRVSGSAADAVAPPAGLRLNKFRSLREQAPGSRSLLLLKVDAGHHQSPGSMLVGVLDVSKDETVLTRYRAKLLAVVVLAVLLSAALGYLLARRGLAPLRAISADIGRVDAERLHARIAHDGWPAELHQLALTFDAMMARLEGSFEQLSRFSSDLAHEFRSPINNLVAAASVTLRRARDPAEYEKTLEIVVEEGNRLSRMVTSMLFLARADNAKQAVAFEQVSTRVEFQKLIDFFELMADEQGVALTAHGDCTLRADPLLLRQALSNLVANALRYTARGGAISLAARDQGRMVAICVGDSGCGIAAEHLPLLFDRFYRADAARSSQESTGLGLALVRSIAELHGGSVLVTSTPGEGSQFTVLIPKRTQSQTA
jgi:two-component system heavy metal sensor histidine kinase CusS